MILTHPDQSETSPLASQLGEKLIQEKNDKSAALACFIIAEDTDKAIEIWADEAKERVKKKPASYLKELAVVVLKSVMLKAVVGNTKPCPELERLAAEFVRAEIGCNFDLAKIFIEKLPISRPEVFELKALYDRIMGLMGLERPQLWEVEALPSHKPKASQKPAKAPESTNPFTSKAVPPMKTGPMQSAKANPFPGLPDSGPGISKNPFPGSGREEAKESIPTIPKTEPFKRASAEPAKDPHQVPQPARIAPPPMMPVAKPGFAPTQPATRPEDPNRPKTSPFSGAPERAAMSEVAQPPKQAATKQIPPSPPASVPEIPKTVIAQPMKTTPPPPLPSVPRQAQPAFRPPAPSRPEPPMSASPSRSIPAEYNLIYQIWSQAPNFPYVNARLKAEAETKLEELYRKLESGEMAASEAERVMAMTQAFSAGDCPTAMSIQMELVKSAWEANKTWLPVVKNLIKAKQQSK